MSISKSLRFRVFERDNFTCVYCGKRPPDVRLEADHSHPRSKGGPDTIENLVTACHGCNRGKAARPIRQSPANSVAGAVEEAPWSVPDIDDFVLAPKESKDTCEECGEAIDVWWQGQVIGQPFPGAIRVQWFGWLMGEPTFQSIVTVADVLAEGWALFPKQEDWSAACRGVLTQHDHDGRMQWASYGEPEPRRSFIPHPTARR